MKTAEKEADQVNAIESAREILEKACEDMAYELQHCFKEEGEVDEIIVRLLKEGWGLMSDLDQIAKALGWGNTPPAEVLVNDIRARAAGAERNVKTLGLLYAHIVGRLPQEMRPAFEAALKDAEFHYEMMKAQGLL